MCTEINQYGGLKTQGKEVPVVLAKVPVVVSVVVAM